MASKDPDALEKLIFDTKGDVLLIFTRRPEGKNAPGKPASLKRKAPNNSPQIVTMLVSSKHMILVSPVFDAMLSDGKFREGAELLAKGKAEIELPDDNPDAFSIIAQIIHQRNKTVLEQVSFKLLLELAILTEKYQIHEVLGCISDHWVHNLFGTTSFGFKNPPKTPMIPVQIFLFTFLVFGCATYFKRLTKMAILWSDETFGSDPNSRFYIPSSVIEAIKFKRAEAFASVFAAIKSFSQQDSSLNHTAKMLLTSVTSYTADFFEERFAQWLLANT